MVDRRFPSRGGAAPAASLGAHAGLMEALGVAVYVTDAGGRLTSYNEAAVTLWGWRPPLGDARWCGSWRLYYVDGRPMAHADCPMAVAPREGRPVRGEEAIAERPDGVRVPFIPYPTPLRDDAGRLVGPSTCWWTSPIARRPRRRWPRARHGCGPYSRPRPNASSSSRQTAGFCR